MDLRLKIDITLVDNYQYYSASCTYRSLHRLLKEQGKKKGKERNCMAFGDAQYRMQLF